MLQHIYDELLIKLDHYKFKHGKNVWAEFVANELLDMIEGFGMLPPTESMNPICLDPKNGSVFEISYNCPIDKNGQYPLWEPENE